MLIIILLMAAFNLTSSTPVLPPTSDFEVSVPTTIFGRELPECVNAAHYRTIQGIVFSCLSTIFACTWVAFHPDVPSPERSTQWLKFRDRVPFMAIAILAPEYMVAVAFYEWGTAISHAVAYNQKHHGVTPPSIFIRWFFAQEEKPVHWTITHGFLLEMGGLVDDSGKVILSVEDIPEPLDLSKEEINDKSKGDFLTKALVVLQTAWFILQCLARWDTHLTVTGLEIMTLTYAPFSIITYALWWNKPQSIGLALRMSQYKRAEGDGTSSKVALEESTDEANPLLESGSQASRKPGFMKRVTQAAKSLICRWGRLMGGAIVGSLPHRVLSLTFGWVVRVIIRLSRLADADLSKSEILPSVVALVFMIHLVFGVLHFITACLSSFPSTYTEFCLWTLSVALTTLFQFPVLFIAGVPYDDKLIVTGFLYTIPRIILLVLPFTTLRNLPPDALRNVPWTTFIPHL